MAEGAPDFGGHKLARALAEAGIESTAIADSSIFAMMARVNKVSTSQGIAQHPSHLHVVFEAVWETCIACCEQMWTHKENMSEGLFQCAVHSQRVICEGLKALQVLIGAQSLLANGGVMAPCGAHLVALAAKRHSVPFVVLAGLHKLSPLFPHDPSTTFNDFKVRVTWESCLLASTMLLAG